MKKRLVSIGLLLSVLMGALTLPVFAGELSNFKKVGSYAGFSDVPANAWYRENVQTAYEMGLLSGKSAARFDPASNLTLAEAAKLAACLNSIYETGNQDFAKASPWYSPYVEYLTGHELLPFAVSDWTATATRAQFAALLAASLPPEALVQINDVADGAIPDVPAGAWYFDAVYTLYRAGVLTGSGSTGSFLPNANIQRSEVAAIIARMADVNQRKTVTLDPALTGQTLFAQCSPSVVYIEVADASGRVFATGSGFFISADGKLVTNHHVIKGASSATVKTTDGKVHKVLGVYDASAELDLAVLQVEGSGYSYLPQGDSKTLSTGANIYAIGSPLGLENSLSTGIISSPSRTVNGGTYIQITAPISPGSSGGALLDERGQVIGVTKGSLVDGQSLNLAVPIHQLEKLKKTGQYQSLSAYAAQTASSVSLNASPSSVSLAVGETATIHFTVTDPDQVAEYYDCSFSTGGVCSYQYGDWYGDDFPIYLTALKAGTTQLTVWVEDEGGNKLTQRQVTVTVTAASSASKQYYAGFYPALDYGVFVGAPVDDQVVDADSAIYFYRLADFQVDAKAAVSGYFDRLEQEGFVYFTGFDDNDGNPVIVYIYRPTGLTVAVSAMVLGGTPGVAVTIMYH